MELSCFVGSELDVRLDRAIDKAIKKLLGLAPGVSLSASITIVQDKIVLVVLWFPNTWISVINSDGVVAL